MGSVEGLAQVESAFNSRLKEIEGYTRQALISIAMDLKTKSIQLAPLDTGALRASAYVDPIQPMLVKMGFNQEYATIQHEELGYNHPKGGQAKYLEQPFKENFETYINFIGNEAGKGTR